MDLTVSEELIMMAIGREVLTHLDCGNLAQEVQCEAVRLLEHIKRILDDEALSDPECFQKIEAIVSLFHSHGLSTSRHDFG